MTDTAAGLLDEHETFITALFRIRAEFLEMPGLTVSVAQAARLWALDTAICQAVLTSLVDAGFLIRNRHQLFSRAE